MKDKVFIAVSFGTIAYLIVVIVGIIMGLALEIILFKALIGLLIITLGSFLLTYILENFKIEEEKESESILVSQKNDQEELITADSEKEFSPIEVPVLETITRVEGD